MTDYYRIVLLVFLILFWGCDSSKKRSDDRLLSEQQQSTGLDLSAVNTDEVLLYECGDSLRFTADIKQGSTWIVLPDTSLKLSRVASGSGAKYRGGSFLFWSKGREALLQMPVGSLMKCELLNRGRGSK